MMTKNGLGETLVTEFTNLSKQFTCSVLTSLSDWQEKHCKDLGVVGILGRLLLIRKSGSYWVASRWQKWDGSNQRNLK